MAWQDRLRQASYTSPETKTTQTFDFEDMRKTFTKKGTAFEFPDAEGTFIQQTRNSGRQYPLRIFFWGNNYDLEAKAFDKLLHENGIGILTHPIDGAIDVVPFGAITQLDKLKTAGNQAIIELTFWTTIDLLFPASQVDPGAEVVNAVVEYNTKKAEDFEEVIDVDSVVEQATLKNSYQKILDVTKNGLQTIADTQDDVKQQFDAIYDSINASIDTFINDPLTLAFETVIFLQSPARALTSITARLDGYKNLVNDIITSANAIAIPGIENDSRVSNNFHNDDLYVSTYITGQILSVVNNEFITKTDVLEAADAIISLFDDVVVWRDDNFLSLSEIDTGGSYQKLQEAVAIAAGFLVQISFTLKQERRLTLDRPRTFIDLVGELYQETDAQYDFFITSNDLSGAEIKELPRGREIVYYI